MVFLAPSTVSIIFAASAVFFATLSTYAKSSDPYSQLVFHNFYAASLTRGTSIKLSQKILDDCL